MSFHRLKEQFVNDNSTNPRKPMTSQWTYMLILQYQGQLCVSPRIPAVHSYNHMNRWAACSYAVCGFLLLFLLSLIYTYMTLRICNSLFSSSPSRDGISMPRDMTFNTAWWWLYDWWLTNLLPGSNLCFVNLCLHLHCALPGACHLCLCILALTQVSP